MFETFWIFLSVHFRQKDIIKDLWKLVWEWYQDWISLKLTVNYSLSKNFLIYCYRALVKSYGFYELINFKDIALLAGSDHYSILNIVKIIDLMFMMIWASNVFLGLPHYFMLSYNSIHISLALSRKKKIPFKPTNFLNIFSAAQFINVHNFQQFV